MLRYSAEDLLKTLLVGCRIGLIHLICYSTRRAEIFETYWTIRRGVETMDNSYRLAGVFRRLARRLAIARGRNQPPVSLRRPADVPMASPAGGVLRSSGGEGSPTLTLQHAGWCGARGNPAQTHPLAAAEAVAVDSADSSRSGSFVVWTPCRTPDHDASGRPLRGRRPPLGFPKPNAGDDDRCFPARSPEGPRPRDAFCLVRHGTGSAQPRLQP